MPFAGRPQLTGSASDVRSLRAQVKAWCYYESRLLGAHHGLISTYALETMVLYIFNLYHTQLHSPLRVRACAQGRAHVRRLSAVGCLVCVLSAAWCALQDELQRTGHCSRCAAMPGCARRQVPL